MRSSIHIVNVDSSDTWTRYKPGLCDQCQANCCTMPLEVRVSDLVRLGLVDEFEAENEDPARIAKRLQKARVVERYNTKAEVFTMMRRADGDCTWLDAKTRRCTVYEQRPDTCRLHPQKKSPRVGYCAFGAKGL
jgi:Fe-S-cluster containining protein